MDPRVFHQYRGIKGTNLRLITDNRKLNCLPLRFSAETITRISALDYIECDDLMITIDLKDGFWHIPHPRRGSAISRHMVGRVLILPFGTHFSPNFFHRVVRYVVLSIF